MAGLREFDPALVAFLRSFRCQAGNYEKK